MGKSEQIIDDLKADIASKKQQRRALLSQLGLLDVQIDRYDDIIKNIDKEAIGLISSLNASISGVSGSYDAVIDSGCKTDLAWVEVDNWSQLVQGGSGDGATLYSVNFTRYKVKRDPNRKQSIPYYGIKYYRKPSNRDYGSSVIADFYGNISYGSSIIAVTDEEGTPTGIQIGDTITDSLETPQAFDASDLPTVIGFGQTSSVGILTSLVGGIENGSNIFAHFGAGSLDGVSPGMVLISPGILEDNSAITGFGITSVSVEYYTSGGILTTGILSCTSVILDKNAIDTLEEGDFSVGIVTTSPAIFISTSALDTVTGNLFTAIRTANADDIDKDFDPLKNPNAPLKIGIIDGSTLGFGNSAFYDNSGFPSERQSYNPNKTYVDTRHETKTQCLFKNDGTPRNNSKWDSDNKECIIKPEPDVGAGAAVYYDGSTQWPIKNEPIIVSGTITGFSQIYASLGEELVVKSGINTGLSIGYTSTPPGGACSSGTLSALNAAITSATNNKNTVVSQNSSKAQSLVESTKALRRQREEKETYAWSLLQASASLRQQIQLLEEELKQLININLSAYE
jgi:hypothetical protein